MRSLSEALCSVLTLITTASPMVSDAGYGISNGRHHLWLTDPTNGIRYIIATSTGSHFFWGTSNLQSHKKEMPHNTGGDSGDEQEKFYLQEYSLISKIRKFPTLLARRLYGISICCVDMLPWKLQDHSKDSKPQSSGKARKTEPPFASTECVKGQTFLQLHNRTIT